MRKPVRSLRQPEDGCCHSVESLRAFGDEPDCSPNYESLSSQRARTCPLFTRDPTTAVVSIPCSFEPSTWNQQLHSRGFHQRLKDTKYLTTGPKKAWTLNCKTGCSSGACAVPQVEVRRFGEILSPSRLAFPGLLDVQSRLKVSRVP